MANLPHMHDLISESWHDFKKHWNETFKISSWFLIAPAIYFVLALIAGFFPVINHSVNIFGAAISFAIILITSIRLAIWILAKNKGIEPPKKDTKIASALALSYLWISVLSAIAVLGGTVLFVLPGIWLLVRFKFSIYNFLEEGHKGTQALAASSALVHGRWWATFWRILVPQTLFLVIYTAIMAIITSIVGAIAGGVKMQIVLSPTGEVAPIVFAIRYLIEGLGQAIIMPLFIWVEIKLFHQLKNTR